MKKLKTISALFTALSMMFVMGVSQAVTYSFDNITNNSNTDLSSQLSVNVLLETSGEVSFAFYNNVGTASSITDIYFDVGDPTQNDLFTSFAIGNTTSGVSFDLAPKPENLPAGNSIDPKFLSDFGGDSTQVSIDDDNVKTNGVSENGVNTSTEYITFLGTLGGTFIYQDVLDQLLSGQLRIGLHIQAIDADCNGVSNCSDSDSYVNTPNVVPVPAAAWLFGTALFGFFAASRRKKIS